MYFVIILRFGVILITYQFSSYVMASAIAHNFSQIGEVRKSIWAAREITVVIIAYAETVEEL